MKKKPTLLSQGDVLGPYRIEKLIGKGGMGEVYLAYENPINRAVAIKVINANQAQEQDTVERFLNEGRTLSLVNHVNIVTVFSVSQQESYYYIAMEFIDGRSIDEICQEFAMPAREATPLFLQMVNGLIALHSKNIIHRDLKPQNIFYQKDNRIKILDLGIAKVYGEENMVATTTGMVVGTVRYIAPEVAYGRPATAASDIWSLGAIFYEILCGTKLIKAENQMQALSALVKFTAEFPEETKSWIDPEMQQIVKKMLEADPDKRYKDVQQLKNDLHAYSMRNPSQDLWHYQHIGTRVKNSDTVKTQLRQRGFSLSAMKRIMIEAIYQNKILRMTNISPDTTMKMNIGFEEDITNQAITKAIKSFETSRHRALSSNRWKNLGTWSAVACGICAVMFGVKYYFDHRPVAKIEPVQLPVVAAPIEPAVQTVAPQPVVETKEIIKEVVVEKEVIVEKKAEVKKSVQPDTFGLQTPVLIVANKNLILKIQDGRNPANAADAIDNPPQLSWKPLASAHSYLLEVAKDSDFSKIVWSQNTDKTSLVWKQVKPGDYYWRVRGKNAKGKSSNYSDVSELSVRSPAAVLTKSLSAKIESSPESANQAKASLNLKWSPIPFAKKYRVTVKDTKSGDTVVKEVTEEPHKQLNLPQGLYKATVVALDGSDLAINGESNAADIEVLLQLLIPAPELMSPPDAAAIVMAKNMAMPTVFMWNKSANAKKYTIEIATDAKFTNVISKSTSEQNRFILKQTLKSGSYFWRVQAVTDNATSSWGKPRQLTVQFK